MIGSQNDPEKAIAEIAQLKPELVICKWRLLSMDGYTLMKEVGSLGVCCKFIVVASTYSYSNMRQFYKAGGYDYWLSPIESEKIVEALDGYDS